MDEQMQLLQQVMSRPVPAGSAPIDVSVSRQYGESTLTMRTQLVPAAGRIPPPPPSSQMQQLQPASMPLSSAADISQPMPGTGMRGSFWASTGRRPSAEAPEGIGRTHTGNSFYEEQSEVPALLAEIERLKRKALSRGVNLTSKDEHVPTEDMAVLKQVFAIADESGDGFIGKEELAQLHVVLGEPLVDEELNSAFKAMDSERKGQINFEDFLAW